MYTPSHFEESDPERLQALIVKHPLGILVTQGASGLDANHLAERATKGGVSYGRVVVGQPR